MQIKFYKDVCYLSIFKRYQSKFKDTVKEEVKINKQDHRTMGYAKEPVPKPNEYLKAHEKEFKLPES